MYRWEPRRSADEILYVTHSSSSSSFLSPPLAPCRVHRIYASLNNITSSPLTLETFLYFRSRGLTTDVTTQSLENQFLFFHQSSKAKNTTAVFYCQSLLLHYLFHTQSPPLFFYVFPDVVFFFGGGGGAFRNLSKEKINLTDLLPHQHPPSRPPTLEVIPFLEMRGIWNSVIFFVTLVSMH